MTLRGRELDAWNDEDTMLGASRLGGRNIRHLVMVSKGNNGDAFIGRSLDNLGGRGRAILDVVRRTVAMNVQISAEEACAVA